MSDDTDATSSSPPGWYPYGEGRQRWWDGEAFGEFAPAPPPLPPPPPPRKPKIGKKAKIALVALALSPLAAVLLMSAALLTGIFPGGSSAVALNDIPGTEEQTAVMNELDGCQRVYDLFLLVQTARLSDDRAAPKFRGLRDAAKLGDPLLASGLDDLLDARSTTQIGDAMTGIMRRCLEHGYVSAEELDAYNAAVPAR
jgi:hypothetical protein